MWGALLVGALGASAFAAEPTGVTDIPEPFVRFEHMAGSWKGTGAATANKIKGWPETHLWAWKFVNGTPTGMTLEWKGDKGLAKGFLSYDPKAKQYRLEGSDASDKPAVFAGAMDKMGKALVLTRANPTEGGKDRLTIRLNSNLIRYTLEFDHQEPGAPQFKRVIEVGLTKEGESFAAGGSSSDLPKCILTGGAATMTVSYQGKSYPICCSGCRDEFNDNPEKYAKKAAEMAAADGGKPDAKPAAKVGKDDGSFDGLDDEEPATKSAMPSPTAKPKANSEPAKPKADAAAGKSDAKAASQLKLGQNLEKSGKTASALKYYQQVVKDFPDTPQAKTASARIKALQGK
ncbi:YHS domain-containing protein [Singulisphaera sp. PoT]|uniref:YHS domain-containing protein n=1 Tax=Singulisphaera sp. PoT TaxID=3411797 RepID=UPI003BF46269